MLHWAELAVENVGPAVFAIVVFLLFLPLSFLIPSSSGLATVAMPIMAPLAAFVGVQAALIVTAFQSGSGLMNLFIPTSAVVMGSPAIARVSYGSYLRWVWPRWPCWVDSSSSFSAWGRCGMTRAASEVLSADVVSLPTAAAVSERPFEAPDLSPIVETAHPGECGCLCGYRPRRRS